MADTRKIVSETFVDEKGNVVKDAKDAARIEVVEKLPNGETQSTVLIRKGS
jgi:hypothetical protein